MRRPDVVVASLTRSSATHAQAPPAVNSSSLSSRGRLRPSTGGISSPPPGSGGWTLPPLNHFMTLPRTFLASHFGSSVDSISSTPNHESIVRANRNRRSGPSSSTSSSTPLDTNLLVQGDDEECETHERFVLPRLMQLRDVQDATGERSRPLEEIDLTVSSSEDEGGEPNAGENDDVIEIHSPMSSMTMSTSQPRRKRRRPGAVKGPKRPCVTAMMRSAECTNVGMQNNEAVEKFKHLLKCAICLDVLEDITSTVCGHIFCAGCICQAIRASGKCPLCQRRLHLKDTHPLFF
uniref:RING-type domain-containing protein n=1 Tax=Hyaloperonospora arabidopsidis (strain Emoy2) TaxID=559515 RepID=M4BL21_HYAAE